MFTLTGGYIKLSWWQGTDFRLGRPIIGAFL